MLSLSYSAKSAYPSISNGSHFEFNTSWVICNLDPSCYKNGDVEAQLEMRQSEKDLPTIPLTYIGFCSI